MSAVAFPAIPVFEVDEGKDTFSLDELRANFWIVNAPRVVLRFEPEAAAVLGVLRLEHDGEVTQEEVPDFTQGPARVGLDLLRGRNRVVLSWKTESGAAPSSFPVFYKTGLRDWLESIVKALIVLLVIQFYIIQPFYIPTGSMENTLKPKNYIMVERLSYMFSPPRRGDVIVFQYPEDPRKDFIKRLVAVGGDTVQVLGGKLYVNDVPLDEPYVRFETTPPMSRQFGPYIVPRNCLFAMGDNRDRSADSRLWGPLPLFRMKGKAFLVYFPFNAFGLVKHEHGIFAQAARAAPMQDNPDRP